MLIVPVEVLFTIEVLYPRPTDDTFPVIVNVPVPVFATEQIPTTEPA
jgi:hypothetical protein